MAKEPRDRTRRQFLAEGIRAIGVLAVGGIIVPLTRSEEKGDTVWQIDPDKCVACDRCATACVLDPSAVKCVQDYALCGYCDLCFGFLEDQRAGDDEGAENQRCPTGAILRSFVEEPYYEYSIDELACVGCGKCVKGCRTFGNGSFILQIRHDRCVNCNECKIATVCPADAFVRVPAHDPYLLRSRKQAE